MLGKKRNDVDTIVTEILSEIQVRFMAYIYATALWKDPRMAYIYAIRRERVNNL